MKKLYKKLCEYMEPKEAILNMILVPVIVIGIIVATIVLYGKCELHHNRSEGYMPKYIIQI